MAQEFLSIWKGNWLLFPDLASAVSIKDDRKLDNRGADKPAGCTPDLHESFGRNLTGAFLLSFSPHSAGHEPSNKRALKDHPNLVPQGIMMFGTGSFTPIFSDLAPEYFHGPSVLVVRNHDRLRVIMPYPWSNFKTPEIVTLNEIVHSLAIKKALDHNKLGFVYGFAQFFQSPTPFDSDSLARKQGNRTMKK